MLAYVNKLNFVLIKKYSDFYFSRPHTAGGGEVQAA